MKKIFLVLILAALPSIIFAGTSTPLKIKSYMIASNGNLYLEFTEDPAGIDFGATKYWGNHAYVDKNHSSFNTIVASLMTAYSLDNNIVIHYTLMQGLYSDSHNTSGFTLMRLDSLKVSK